MRRLRVGIMGGDRSRGRWIVRKLHAKFGEAGACGCRDTMYFSLLLARQKRSFFYNKCFYIDEMFLDEKLKIHQKSPIPKCKKNVLRKIRKEDVYKISLGSKKIAST